MGNTSRKSLCICTILVLATCAQADNITVNWTGDAGDLKWDTAGNWSPEMVPNNDDQNTYDVIINGAFATLPGEQITIESLLFNQGAAGGSLITGGGALFQVNGVTTVNNGDLEGSGMFQPIGTLDIPGFLTLAGSWQTTANTVLIGTGGPNGGITMKDSAQLTINGSMVFLKDGSVTMSGGAPKIIATGEISKPNAVFPNGISQILPELEVMGGTLSVSQGNLRLDGPTKLIGAQVNANGTGTVAFGGAGENTEIESSLNVMLDGDGEVVFLGGNVLLNGTLTTIGNSSGGVFLDNADLTGGTLNAAHDAPFVQDHVLSLVKNVTNQGAYDFAQGTVANLTNTNTSPTGFVVVTPAANVRLVDDAGLINNGHVRQDNSLKATPDGKIQNNGTWLLTRSSSTIANQLADVDSAMFTNTAELVMDPESPGNAALISMPFTNTASGLIRVKSNGGLTLNNELEDKLRLEGGTIECTGSVGGFQLGGTPASRSFAKDLNFILIDGGRAKWASGTHTLQGQINGSGAGAVGVDGAILEISGDVDLNFRPESPFTMASNSSILKVDGTLTNQGTIQWDFGLVSGAGELLNASNATIMDKFSIVISDGQAGLLRNNGLLLVGGNGLEAVIELDTNGKLINDGTLRFQANGGIFRDNDIESTNIEVQNRGEFAKTVSTDSLVAVPYKQMDDGQTVSKSGALKFKDTAVLQGGMVKALGANTKVRFLGPATTDNVTFEFSDGGVAEYSGDSDVVHIATGKLTGSGDGSLLMSGVGKFQPVAGSCILDFSGQSKFHQTAGAVGKDASTVINRGNVLMDFGETVGGYTNEAGGNFTFKGGRIKGTYLNQGDFTWDSGGLIEGQFTNEATDEASMNLIDTVPGFTPLLLAAGAKLINNGTLAHDEAILELGEDAELINESGHEYTLSNGAAVERTGAAIENAKMINRGTLSKEGALSSVISVLFKNEQGTIESEGGTLSIFPVPVPNGNPVIDGGSLKANPGTVSIVGPRMTGTITHNTGSGGLIDLSSPELNGGVVATGTGRVEISSPTVKEGESCTIGVTDTAEVAIEGSGAVDGQIIHQQGTLRLEGPTLMFLAEAGKIQNNATVEFHKSGTADVTLVGPTSGSNPPTVRFVNNEVARLSTGHLRFDGSFGFENNKTFEIPQDGFLFKVSTNANVLFQNAADGVFKKTGGASTSLVQIPFNNQGTVEVVSGSIDMDSDVTQLENNTLSGGKWIVNNATVLTLEGGAAHPILNVGSDASIIVRGTGNFVNLPNGATTDLFNNNGQICLENNTTFLTSGEFENNGTVKVDAGSTLTVNVLDNDGTMTVNGTLIFGTEETIQTGTLGGAGTVNGNRVVNAMGGTTAPGQSPGVLTIDGDFVNDPTGIIEIELAGSTPGNEHDQLVVNGTATLGGTLTVSLIDGFMPQEGDAFVILTASTVSGSFDNAPRDENDTGVLDFNDGTFTVLYNPDNVVLTGFVPATPFLLGDVNCDGVVDLLDVSPFASALTDPAGFPGCDILRADMNQDDLVNGADVQPFVNALVQP